MSFLENASTVLTIGVCTLSIIDFIRSLSLNIKIRIPNKIPRRFRSGRIVFKSQDGDEIFIISRVNGQTSKVIYNRADNIVRTESNTQQPNIELRLASSAESLAFLFIKEKARKTAPNASVKIRKENNLIMQLLEKKAQYYTRTYMTLFVSLCVTFGFSLSCPAVFNSCVLLLQCALILLCFVNQRILRFRVRKGMYGTCAFEAREILSYIMEQSKDGQSGGRPRLIFPDEEIDHYVLRRARGSEVHAR